MNNLGNSRASLALAIIVFYLTPIIALSAYSLGLMTIQGSWILFSTGLALAAFGSCFLLLMIYRWENKLRLRLMSAIKSTASPTTVATIETPQPVLETSPKTENNYEEKQIEQERVLHEAIADWKQKHDKLQSDLLVNENELQQSLEERKALQAQILAIRSELDSHKNATRAQLQQEQAQQAEYQKTINDQRALLDAQQQQISALEIKEKELAYEIKTLVSLTNYDTPEPIKPSPEPPLAPALTLYEPKKNPPIDKFSSITNSAQIKSADMVSSQLDHFVDTAANISGVQQLHGIPSHLYDLPSDNYALELRRLCENLNMENRYIVFLHSPRENKILFVNDHVKSILGWSPDKFMQQFSDIIPKGNDELQNAASHLSANREAVCSMQAKSINNELFRLNCHLKVINSGTFRNHNICIMY